MDLKTISCDVNIVLGPKALGVFVDSACTIPVTAVHFGDVSRGKSTQFPMYLKNIEMEQIRVGMQVVEDISSWGTVNMAPASVTLNFNDIASVTITLQVIPGVVLALKAFTIKLLEVA